VAGVVSAADADPVVVRRYLDSLAACGTSRDAFDAVHRMLKSDPEVTRHEMEAIAVAFVGGRSSYPSKQRAADAIESEFLERLRSAKKRDAIAKTRPW
jgi:hypothetical protein